MSLSNPFVVRIVIVFLWLRVGWHAPIFRPISNRYAIGFSISALLFMASVFVAPPLRFGLWGLGLASDLLTPRLSGYSRKPRICWDRPCSDEDLRLRFTLRYPILYLAVVPLASFMIESVFVQPQALALSVPIAGIGVIVMAVQLTNMLGSA